MSDKTLGELLPGADSESKEVQASSSRSSRGFEASSISLDQEAGKVSSMDSATGIEPCNNRPPERAESTNREQKGKEALELEEYDYTAQRMLQAPLRKRTLFSPKAAAGLERARQEKLEPASVAPENTRFAGKSHADERSKTFILLLKALGIASFCFLFSYGISSLLYLQKSKITISTRDAGEFWPLISKLLSYSQGNILIALFFIAFVSSIITVVLGSVLSLLRVLQRQIYANKVLHNTQNKSANSQLDHRASVSGGMGSQLSAATEENPSLLQVADPARELSPDCDSSVMGRAGQMLLRRNEASAQKIAESLPEQRERAERCQGTKPDVELAPVAERKYSGEQEAAAPEKPYTSSEAAPAKKSKTAESYAESRIEYYDMEQQNGQFYSCLKFLLQKKLFYYLQASCCAAIGVSVSILALSYLGVLISPIIILFVVSFLVLSTFVELILHNQYRQSLEVLHQGWLQQAYQYSSPINSYNQLYAVNMLYSLAIVEPRYFERCVSTEFQNILQSTRSSWYQEKYSKSPSLLVEEVLRKLLSAVDFQQLLFGAREPRSSAHVLGRQKDFLRKYCYYQLFLKNLQSFRMFCAHETFSLLSRLNSVQSQDANGAERVGWAKDRLLPKFVLENYYLVGVNLSNLRMKEVHFQNCQLSLSNWSHSDLSDCSISSSRLDHMILYASNWRRFLWAANIARELNIEYGFFLQGNIKGCNLQGLQSQLASYWCVQHCLLQECNLNHSAFCVDNWQNVKFSDCDLNAVSFLLQNESLDIDSEDLAQILGKHLQIKGL